jgi:O-acetyl-ADP-ribose deacetylase (regulator of RNase III)
VPIHYASGDLFADPARFAALAHGCNCQGTMGAGIAVAFRKRYPAMFAEYQRRCRAVPRLLNPGEVFFWREDGLPAVFNLATQDGNRRGDARLDAVATCLSRMRQLADTERLTTVGMPRVGAGLGGLRWEDVKAEIGRAFDGWAGTLTVFEEFTPAGKA